MSAVGKADGRAGWTMPNRPRLVRVVRAADHRPGPATVTPTAAQGCLIISVAGNPLLAVPVNRPRAKNEYEVDLVMAKASVGH